MRLLTDPKRALPLIISAVVGILILVSVVRPTPLRDGLLAVAQITMAIGLLLGLGNVLLTHLRALRTRAPGWSSSIVIVVAAIAVFALEMTASTLDPETGMGLSTISAEVFQYVYQPLMTSLLGLLTFFALRASWRALHARPGEALPIVLVATVFLVAGGPWAGLLPGLPETLDWVRAYPALGVARGLLLGVGLGALVASVRLLLGFDQPYLDR